MLYKRNPQLNKNGELIHLLSTEGLPKATLMHILDTAANFVSVSDREVKKVHCCAAKAFLICFLKTQPVPAPPLTSPPRGCLPM